MHEIMEQIRICTFVHFAVKVLDLGKTKGMPPMCCYFSHSQLDLLMEPSN